MITVCLCSSRTIINRKAVEEITNMLRDAGYEVQQVDDLCETAMNSREEMAAMAGHTVIACYPRAVNALFDRFDLKPKQVLNLRKDTVKDILKSFNIAYEGDNNGFTTFALAKPGHDAWYPALDRERCIQCGKCHDFCLFGVYTIEDGEVRVTNPANCKTDCPACARTCPVKAVIFPKYPKSPINGGLDDEEAAVAGQGALYNDALRMRLNQRRLSGISLLRK